MKLLVSRVRSVFTLSICFIRFLRPYAVSVHALLRSKLTGKQLVSQPFV
ncbi:MAG: hypothetical protein LKJ22_10565 [Liquorilactobacillus nagelii]|nr:hypothetical protein [Liquorilactobacillus nagelii]MCI1922344.1 hypothetical protein [Liquorilactobacillus nagelii]